MPRFFPLIKVAPVPATEADLLAILKPRPDSSTEAEYLGETILDGIPVRIVNGGARWRAQTRTPTATPESGGCRSRRRQG
jgi:hypothetical protein